MSEEQRRRLSFHIRMQLAALRQRLKNSNDIMSEEAKNEVLDQMLTLTKLLNEIEK